MKEEIKELLGNSLEHLNLYVYDAFYETSEKVKNLCIVLDSEEIIDIDRVVEATKIINPIIDDASLEDFDVLDIYAKEKGDGNNE